jgi:tRNA(Ile)-lysidine synthase
MKLAHIPNGTYVVAVSGGVDSMVLLDILAQQLGLELIVAHFQHGIRKDAEADLLLVEATAAQLDRHFVYAHGELGPDTSELEAREARYAFLRKVASQHHADAIITAHHQDDVLETAVLNMLRGTGRKGLASLRSTHDLLRPLLDVTKKEIMEYAREHHIQWREDSTNTDERYLRNYIRKHIIRGLSPTHRNQLLAHIAKAAEANPLIDELLHRDIAAHSYGDALERAWFVKLPHDIATEAMAAWLRQKGVRDFDRKLIERLVVGAKVATPGKSFDVNTEYLLKVERSGLKLSSRSSS